MYLETPKGDHDGRPWDEVNLATLRGLIRLGLWVEDRFDDFATVHRFERLVPIR